jgi:hypothetical protein
MRSWNAHARLFADTGAAVPAVVNAIAARALANATASAAAVLELPARLPFVMAPPPDAVGSV